MVLYEVAAFSEDSLNNLPDRTSFCGILPNVCINLSLSTIWDLQSLGMRPQRKPSSGQLYTI